MKALEIGSPLHAALRDKAEPRPADGEVLLRIQVAGCDSADLAAFLGINASFKYPRIPGHEISGLVEATGLNVEGWPIGAPALVFPHISCGHCPACRLHRFNACPRLETLGIHRDGGLCELLVVPAAALLTSTRLLPVEMALVEPLSVGFHAVDRARVIGHETVVAVLGCDITGLGAVAGAAARGARVLAFDEDSARLELARAAGAEHAIDRRGGDMRTALRDLTGGTGPDVMIDASTWPGAFRTCLDEVACGGRVVCVGDIGAPPACDASCIVDKELDVLGSLRATPDDFRSALALLESRNFPVNAVVTHTVPLAEAGAVLSEWANHPASMLKVHVTP
jgi:L-galactonate 5-dehydrogenase